MSFKTSLDTIDSIQNLKRLCPTEFLHRTWLPSCCSTFENKLHLSLAHLDKISAASHKRVNLSKELEMEMEMKGGSSIEIEFEIKDEIETGKLL